MIVVLLVLGMKTAVWEYDMQIFDKFEKAFSDRDIDALGALFHDDYEMTMHSNGKVLTKQE